MLERADFPPQGLFSTDDFIHPAAAFNLHAEFPAQRQQIVCLAHLHACLTGDIDNTQSAVRRQDKVAEVDIV